MIFVCVEPTAFKPIFFICGLCIPVRGNLPRWIWHLSLSSPYEQQQQNHRVWSAVMCAILTALCTIKCGLPLKKKCGCARSDMVVRGDHFFWFNNRLILIMSKSGKHCYIHSTLWMARDHSIVNTSKKLILYQQPQRNS